MGVSGGLVKSHDVCAGPIPTPNQQPRVWLAYCAGVGTTVNHPLGHCWT